MKKVLILVSALTVLLTSSVNAAFINFDDFARSGYAGQYVAGTDTTQDGGFTLNLQGNLWVSINLPTEVVSGTFLYFDFWATGAQSEIFGIGFENDNTVSNSLSDLFRIGGSDSTRINSVGSYVSGDGVVQYAIDLFPFIGNDTFSRMVFIMDNDANVSGTSAFFSNVEICQPGEPCATTSPNLAVNAPGNFILLLLGLVLISRRVLAK